MQGLHKIKTASGIQVHTDEGIQLPVKKRSGKDSYYVYYNRKQVCLSSIPELSSQVSPVFFNYVFGGGHKQHTNAYYDQLLNLNNASL